MEYREQNSNDLSDEALCLLVDAGDAFAEETLVIRYQRLVRSCARPFFLVGGDSEDLLQEGMLGLLSAIRTFDPKRRVTFGTYAATCIRNRIISAIKLASSNKHTPLNTYISFETTLQEQGEDVLYSSIPQGNPENLLLDREALGELHTLLKGQLSALEVQILGLYLSGLSYLEIAHEVARPPKSVDNAVQRIRRKIARHVKPDDFSES